VRDDRVVAVDAHDNQRDVTRDFVLRHWGYEVSWFYPYINKNIDLMKGMRSHDVLKLQRKLNGIGYLVETTGLYDESTFQEVVRFQTDFGLIPNGIAGLQTRALLYQMSD
jgi:N-acetyl-anhydromuramyl-L-alanine amidase AmpD